MAAQSKFPYRYYKFHVLRANIYLELGEKISYNKIIHDIGTVYKN